MPFPRHMNAPLHTALTDTPAVLIHGARQTGKTTLAKMACPDRTYFTLDDASLLSAAKTDPIGFVRELPEEVILDEIQRAPELFPAIKASIDANRRPGRFLLTGSANLMLLPSLTESLAGRMEVIRLHPLTQAEIHNAPGQFLHQLLSGNFSSQPVQPIGRQLAVMLAGGGYPEPVQRQTQARQRQWHRQYVQAILQRDIQDVATIRDHGAVEKLLQLLAIRTGQLLNVAEVATGFQLTRPTASAYIDVLRRLFLVDLLPAWHNNPGNRLIKAPKIHITDTGLAVALTQPGSPDDPAYRARQGHLLESFVVQEIQRLAGWTDPELEFFHYRDKDQVEVDLVVTRGSQTWGIEVKSAATIFPKDFHGLKRLAEQAKPDFQLGIVLYDGERILPFGPRMWAVPLAHLWKN